MASNLLVLERSSVNFVDVKGYMVCDDLLLNLNATRSVRTLLMDANPPIDEVVDAGIVPKLVRLLDYDNRPELQFEAAWALTNVAAGTWIHANEVVDCGAAKEFIRLIKSPHLNVGEQSIWALANIAGSGPANCDYIIKLGVLEPLLERIDSEIPISFLRLVTLAVMNLCRHKSQRPTLRLVKQLFPTLVFLVNHKDEEVVTNACWAFCFLTDSSEYMINRVANHKILAKFVRMLTNRNDSIVTPLLHVIGNISRGNETHGRALILMGVLSRFRRLLTHTKQSIRKAVARAIENVTEHTEGSLLSGLNFPLFKHMDTMTQYTRSLSYWMIGIGGHEGGGANRLEKYCDWLYSSVAIEKAVLICSGSAAASIMSFGGG